MSLQVEERVKELFPFLSEHACMLVADYAEGTLSYQHWLAVAGLLKATVTDQQLKAITLFLNKATELYQVNQEGDFDDEYTTYRIEMFNDADVYVKGFKTTAEAEHFANLLNSPFNAVCALEAYTKLQFSRAFLDTVLVDAVSHEIQEAWRY